MIEVIEEGWWGIYEYKEEGTWVGCCLEKEEEGYKVSIREGSNVVSREYDEEKIRDTLGGVEAASTHLRFFDRDSDEVAVIPLFDQGVTYNINGRRRPTYTNVHLSETELRFSNGDLSRCVPLSSNYLLITYPLRRILDACNVTHNLGKEPPSVVANWSLTQIPTKKGLYYWKDFVRKQISMSGPSQDEIDEEFRVGVLGEVTATPAHERLKKHLTDRNLQEIHVAGDGHCQFRSIAHHVYGDAAEFEKVRQEVCKHMDANEDSYAAFCVTSHTDTYASYLDRMRGVDPPEWGDAVTLQAAADLYATTFNIVTSSSDALTVVHPSTPEPAATVAWLSYLELSSSMHYNPVVPKDVDGTQPAP
eukprot:TRINITY_DN10582_c3_g1_i1.p1 TRINITY_DN10582_c3_g1~~TRINITY_DN10582_c3_g1_i1.p1  ORF type:complete len:387 (+),score=79.15 TRINITY_DN10582_c3_g1_i1:78-1163(+)